MNNNNRKINTKRNLFMSYINMIVSMVFEFLSRTIIVKTLGTNYLGLSNLYTSIFQVLSLTDLGFSAAIIFNLYKPIAEDDTVKVCALLAYYKKIYRLVGVFIFTIGLMVTPFLHHIIKGDIPTDLNLYLLYLLYLTNSSVSYFLFAYKNALLEAMQRNDIVKTIYTIVHVFQYTLQILSLLLFKNFYIFVTVTILGTILKNIVGEIITRNKYPQFLCKGDLDQDTRKDIKNRVKGLFVCNLSGKTLTSFDSIIISSTLGLGSVAIYNNYLIIFTALTTCISVIRSAMQASVGNKVATDSINNNYKDVFVWQLMFSAIVTYCTVCMLCLYQPFITLWMGNDMLLPIFDVILLCIWFCISEVQHSFLLYLSGNGLWWEMRCPYILSSLQNIILNIILGKLFNITGIIISSLLSALTYGLIWQCKIIFKHYFKKSSVMFFKYQIRYFGIALIACTVSFFCVQ